MLPLFDGRIVPELDEPGIEDPLPDGAEFFESTRFHLFPVMVIVAFHFRSGINRIEAIVEPLTLACPQSVSTVNCFSVVAPVTESPLLRITVVTESSDDANLTPAMSAKSISTAPNDN